MISATKLAAVAVAAGLTAVTLTTSPAITDEVTLAENANLALSYVQALPLRLPGADAHQLGVKTGKIDAVKGKLSDLTKMIEGRTGVELQIDRNLSSYRQLALFDPFDVDGDVIEVRTSDGTTTNVELEREPKILIIQAKSNFWLKPLNDDAVIGIMTEHATTPALRAVVITPMIRRGVTIRGVSM